jgi:hypothetical protein
MIGMMMNNIALGTGIGITIGAVINAGVHHQNRNKQD